MKAYEEPAPNSKHRPAHGPTGQAADVAIQSGTLEPDPIKPVTLLDLQRTAGNQAVIKYVKSKASAPLRSEPGNLSLVTRLDEGESHGEGRFARGDDVTALTDADAQADKSYTTSGTEPATDEEWRRDAPLQRSSLQRDDSSSSGTAGPAPADSQWSQYRDEMEGVRARATARELQAEACVGLAADVLSSLRTHLEAISTVYGTAYKRYSDVIERGKAAAKTEEELIDIGVGILLAVAIGTGVGAAAIALHIEEAVAVEAAKEAITATVTEGLKAAGTHSGLLQVAGTELEPGGLKPEVMKLHLWEQMVDLHSAVLTTIKQTELQSLISSGAEYAIGEIKAQISGGSGADLQVSDLHNLIGTLASDDEASAPLDSSLATATTYLQDVKTKVSSAPDPYGREEEMERDIWILWMSDLGDADAKVLDRDPIEEYLENSMKLITSGYRNGGSLGVDTGIWTSKADCLKMIDAARGQAEALREKYGSLTG